MIKFISEIYDIIELQWQKPFANRILATILIVVYLGISSAIYAISLIP